jgi:hypothetical protein
MVKVILPEDHHPLPLSYGVSHYCYRAYISTIDISAWSRSRDGNTRSEIIRLKDENGPPKEDVQINLMTIGLPKGSNFYGNGIIVVPYTVARRGRVIAPLLYKRHYGTGGPEITQINVESKLNKLSVIAAKKPIITDNLYKLLCNINTLQYAYENIHRKPDNMTNGVSPKTLDGISEEFFFELSNQLRCETFQFAACKRISIPKTSGGTRPLTIVPPRDKIVLEALRLIIQTCFEPIFLDSSHGF